MPRDYRTTILLADINDFAKVNAIYAKYFTDQPPARSAHGTGRGGAVRMGRRIPLQARLPTVGRAGREEGRGKGLWAGRAGKEGEGRAEE